jgi:hypothetical protein
MIRSIRNLSAEEKQKFQASNLFQLICREHTFQRLSLQYYAEYFGKDYVDHSLLIYNQEEPVLCVFAFTNNDTLRFFDSPIKLIYHPLTPVNTINEAFRTLFQNFEENLQKQGINHILFHSDPYFNRYYFDSIQETKVSHQCFVDLKLKDENIRMNLRKSYKSLINWGAKNLTLKTINNTNPELQEFLKFKDLHLTVAGRATRTHESWMLQFEQIVHNQGFLITGYSHDKLVSGTLVLHGSENAYYGVGAYDRNLMSQKLAISHYPLFYSILHAKSIGLKKYFLGTIDMLDPTDNKLNEINNFKKGFTATLAQEIASTVSLSD